MVLYKGTQFGNQPYQEYQHSCPQSKDYDQFLVFHDLVYSEQGTDCQVSHTGNLKWILNGELLTMFNPEQTWAADSTTVISITNQELVLMRVFNSPEGAQVNKYYYTRN